MPKITFCHFCRRKDEAPAWEWPESFGKAVATPRIRNVAHATWVRVVEDNGCLGPVSCVSRLVSPSLAIPLSLSPLLGQSSGCWTLSVCVSVRLPQRHVPPVCLCVGVEFFDGLGVFFCLCLGVWLCVCKGAWARAFGNKKFLSVYGTLQKK